MTVASSFNQLNTVVEALRSADELMPIQQAHVFLTIAAKPGISMQGLEKETGLAQSSCSRNVAALSEWTRHKTAGPDLVEAIEDPEDSRRKIMFLHPKGRALAKRLLQIMDPSLNVEEMDFITATEFKNRAYKVRR